MTPIATIRDVRFRYPHATRDALAGVDWQIDEGAFALLIGRSGTGKSTLLRTLNGLVPHFTGGSFAGSVTVGRQSTMNAGPRQLADLVGFVFQDPEAQMVTNRVEDEIAFGMEHLGVPRPIMRKRLEEVLDLLNIDDLRERRPSTLSGGERQRVAIASIMAMHPHMLVLDEPTSQLDPWGAEEVVSGLTRMSEDLGTAIVMSEHRLERVLAAADTVRLIDDSGGMLDGTPDEIARIVHPVALAPVSQVARQLDMADVPLTVRQARRTDAFAQLRGGALVRQPDVRSFAGGGVVLEMVDVELRHERRAVLRHVDVRVRQGELLAVMGRNGSGKTTLLRAIPGLHPLTSGRIAFEGRALRRPAPGQIAYVPQQPQALFSHDTVLDEMRASARAAGIPLDETVLEAVDLAWAGDRHPSDLSVGERQRAAIAVALAGRPRLLLLDEPTRGMDPWHKRQLATVLGRLRDDGLAIVMATHDVDLVAESASEMMLLGGGEIVAHGSPADVMTDSLTYTTQINKVFGGRWLTADQIVTAAR